MRGRDVSATWAHDPSLYAPPKYRKACTYDAFLPDGLSDFNPSSPAELAGVVSGAEAATRSLNDRARPALRPLGCADPRVRRRRRDDRLQPDPRQ
jgi:hypothetical protein